MNKTAKLLMHTIEIIQFLRQRDVRFLNLNKQASLSFFERESLLPMYLN